MGKFRPGKSKINSKEIFHAIEELKKLFSGISSSNFSAEQISSKINELGSILSLPAQNNSEKFKDLFENAATAYFIIDKKGIIEEVNHSAEKLLCIPKYQICGKEFVSFLNSETLSIFNKCFSEFLSNGNPTECEAEFQSENKIVNTVINVFQINTNNEKLICIGIKDISDFAQAKSEFNNLKNDYLSVFENANDPILIFEPENEIILEANESAAKLYGISKEELIGKSLKDFSKNPKRGERKIEKILKEGKAIKFETEQFTKTGKTLFLEVKASAINYLGKKAILTINHDLTKRKKHENELEKDIARLEMAQKIARFGNWDWDLETDRIKLSGELNTILGFENTEISVKQFLKIVCKEDKESVKDNLEKMRLGKGEMNMDFGIKLQSGEIVYLYALGKVLFDKDNLPKKVFGIFHDITSRKLMEKTLRVSIENLERSNQDLEMFAYVVSHDLKDPLHLITNFFKLFSRRYKGKIDQKADDYIENIQAAVTRMHKLIQGLLAYSRITTRGKSFETNDANLILEDAISNLELNIEKANANVKAEKLPVIVCDEIQISQMFQNLISNAIKFADKNDPEIIISYKENDDEFIFSVSDNGIGILPKYYKRIFEIFQRLHTEEEFEGTGIGLSICKKIADRHGGKIWVESEPGKGSTFYFTLPKREHLLK